MEMVSNGEISRRTAYRYLAYYREMHGGTKIKE
jgi:predicted DNA-binding transcriptional regulator YafY